MRTKLLAGVLFVALASGLTFVTSVDRLTALVSKTMVDIAQLNTTLARALPADSEINEGSYQAYQLLMKQYNSPFEADLAEYQAVLQNFWKDTNPVMTVVPSGPAKALFASLPQTQIPPNAAIQWLAPVARAMIALAGHDAAGLRQARQNFAAVNDEIITLQRRYELEAKKWETGKAQFLCSIQISQLHHAPLGKVPEECRT